MRVEEQIAIIYCGVQGLLNGVSVEKVSECEAELIKVMHKEHEDTLAELRNGNLTDEAKKSIEMALKKVLTHYS